MTSKINFVDPHITSIEKKNLKNAIDSGWVSHGPFVEKFEKKFSKIIKSNYSISVNNGTNAILLILIYLAFKKGDEVIVPSFCYISPIHMLKILGLVPVPVDIKLEDLQINEDQIEQKINKKTKAILLIHNYGNVCDLKKIEKIAKKHSLFIIEDISEVLLSKNGKNFLGSCNLLNKEKHISYASLHASKTLFSGEGGVIFTNSKKISSKLKVLRNHGQKNNIAYFYDFIGGNFRLSNLLASIGYSQLLRLKDIIKKKKSLDSQYTKKLSENENFSLMKTAKNFNAIKWGFPIILKRQVDKVKLMRILNKKSLLCRPGFYGLNQLKYLKIFNHKNTKKLDFKRSIEANRNVIILPMHTKITRNQIFEICDKINFYFSKK